MRKFLLSLTWGQLFFAYILTCFLALAIAFNFSLGGEQQFSYLAKAFLAGKTYFLEEPGTWADTTFYNGHYYYPPGPLPAVVLMPFVGVFDKFGLFFSQGYLQFLLVFLVFGLVYRLARILSHPRESALYLAFAFCFASAFLGVAFWPWRSFFGHVLATLFLLAALVEFLTRRRFWLIGGLFGLIVLTRITAGLGIVFFGLAIIFSRENVKFKNLLLLLVPWLLAFALLGLYNFINFGHLLETGYGTEIMPFPAFAQARSLGVFSLTHLPTNLYYFLLSFPLPVVRTDSAYVLAFPFIQANPWGMSIFLTSPYLLYLFAIRRWDTPSRLLVVTIIIIAIPLLLLYATGYRQFGYRYALDFFPFLFLLWLKNLGRLTRGLKLLIVASAVFNLYLFITLFT
jgi:hypothetical protein